MAPCLSNQVSQAGSQEGSRVASPVLTALVLHLVLDGLRSPICSIFNFGAGRAERRRLGNNCQHKYSRDSQGHEQNGQRKSSSGLPYIFGKWHEEGCQTFDMHSLRKNRPSNFRDRQRFPGG